MFQKAVVIGLGLAALALPAASQAQSLSTYGDVTTVKPGDGANARAFQLTSSNAGAGYAGLADQITSALPLDQITNLSADYQMTDGTFGGGAPRFTIFDPASDFNQTAYVYWGTPAGGTFTDPNAGAGWANTGNYADATSLDARVFVNGFDGINQPNTGVTWSQFVAEAGTADVGFITLDLDAGTFTNLPNGQQMLVNDFAVNSQTFNPGVPEPAVWSMLIIGVAGVGAALRRRPAQVLA